MKVFLLTVMQAPRRGILKRIAVHGMTGREMAKEAERLKHAPGCLGVVTDTDGRSALFLVFPTVTHAEKAQRGLSGLGYEVGKYVMDGEYQQGENEYHLQINGPTVGWDSVDPEDLAAVDAALEAKGEDRDKERKRKEWFYV